MKRGILFKILFTLIFGEKKYLFFSDCVPHATTAYSPVPVLFEMFPNQLGQIVCICNVPTKATVKTTDALTEVQRHWN